MYSVVIWQLSKKNYLLLFATPKIFLKIIKMEALVFDSKTMTLKYHSDYPKPEVVNDDDVLVKVAYSGICGTDLHIMLKEFPALQDRPFALGHEFSGIVEGVGKGCLLAKGQKVVVDPNRPCNICDYCHRGKYQFCSTKVKCNVGIFRDGGWAEYVKVPQDQVFELPEHVSLKQGALCEPYSCVSHGFDRASPLSVGQKILLVGAGIIGNLWVTVLHHHGHREVTISEMNPARLDIVKKMETGFKLVSPQILENEKERYDVIIDCTGVGKVMEININYLKPGGKYLVFGCSPATHRASVVPFDIFDKELTILGVRVNPYSFPTAIGWLSAMGERYLDYEKLGVKTYKMFDYQTAFNDLKVGSISKAVFEM